MWLRLIRLRRTCPRAAQIFFAFPAAFAVNLAA
jgi:hypothetical protein